MSPASTASLASRSTVMSSNNHTRPCVATLLLTGYERTRSTERGSFRSQTHSCALCGLLARVPKHLSKNQQWEPCQRGLRQHQRFAPTPKSIKYTDWPLKRSQQHLSFQDMHRYARLVLTWQSAAKSFIKSLLFTYHDQCLSQWPTSLESLTSTQFNCCVIRLFFLVSKHYTSQLQET